VELAAGLRAQDGGLLAEPLTWTFTTGAPQATLSNQVLFLSDRSGVTNVWAMNPDGTGQHQVSAELDPVLDYAAAPNGGSLVVADGRRLVFLRADGSERRVLTDATHLEFDPTYAPDGSRIAFGRADASTGEGLGLWTWEVGAGSATELELPRPDGAGEESTPGSPGASLATALRAPRYSPDGSALAYVDLSGTLGILELPRERLTLVPAEVAGAPTWDARSSTILLRLRDEPAPPEFSAPVRPPESVEGSGAGIVRRSGTALQEASFAGELQRVVAAPDGRIAWLDVDGTVQVSAGPTDAPAVPDALERVRAVEMIFGPSEGVVLVVIDLPGGVGAIERVDLETGERTRLVRDGRHVRWLP
jgi:hypothetical protein